MAVAFYMDVHIPMAITRQLRLRGVDVAAATEEGTNTLTDDDPDLFARSTSLERGK